MIRVLTSPTPTNGSRSDPTWIRRALQSSGRRPVARCRRGTRSARTSQRAAVLVACPMFFPDLVRADQPEILLVTNTGDTNLHPFGKTIHRLLSERSALHDVVVHEGGDHFSTLDDNWSAVAAWLLPRLKA